MIRWSELFLPGNRWGLTAPLQQHCADTSIGDLIKYETAQQGTRSRHRGSFRLTSTKGSRRLYRPDTRAASDLRSTRRTRLTVLRVQLSIVGSASGRAAPTVRSVSLALAKEATVAVAVCLLSSNLLE
jgi:hypothetical protein